MKTLTLYQCEICNRTYQSEKQALDCEAQGISTSRHKVGDTVYIAVRYHDSKDRPFVKRVVTDLYQEGHETKIVLNEVVQVGKDYYIGCDGRGMGAFGEQEGLFPAHDRNLNLFGEKVEVYSNRLLGEVLEISDDTIEFDF